MTRTRSRRRSTRSCRTTSTAKPRGILFRLAFPFSGCRFSWLPEV